MICNTLFNDFGGLAPQNWNRFGSRTWDPNHKLFLNLQAFAAWQWWNYCSAQVPAGKTILRINMDETSICLFQGDGKGTVFVDKKRRREEPVQMVPRFKRRCCLTHVAFICDRPDLQPLLPQIIIGNFATFHAADFAMLQSRCPPNVTLVRQKSAWNNDRLCAYIVRRLALALRAHINELQPVLLLDAVRLHTTTAVLAACNGARIWPVLVPARMTWLLQPLDTHAFQTYKAHLRARYQSARADLGAGDLSTSQFLECICAAIRHVLQGTRWDSAFDQDGFGNTQTQLSSFVMRHLHIVASPDIQALRPSIEQLSCCFPRRATIPEAALWRPFSPLPVPKALPVMPSRRSEVRFGLAVPLMRPGRTRADHRRAVAVGEAPALAPAAVPAPSISEAVPRGSRLPGFRVGSRVAAVEARR